MGLFGSKRSGGTDLDTLALNYISDGVIILGQDGNIRLINPVAQKMIGQGQEEVLNVSFLSAIKFVDFQGKAVEPALNPITLAVRSGGGEKRATIMPARGDKAVPISLTVVMADGSAILTLRDITRDLKEEEEKSDFISTASHEMRTPVASIEGFLGLAINPQTATIDDRAREYLSQAHNSAQHLGKLFADLLDTTRLDDGKLMPRLTPIEMVGVVQQIANAKAGDVVKKGLKYVFDSGTIVGPKTITPLLYAMADVDFLREILDNLIDNAIKYTAHGEIKVSIRGDDESVIVWVADSGIGIGEEDVPHIFQKFYRADNSDTRTVGGTGLGLYIVRQRVQIMGGKIWLESRVGEGARFYFTIPRLSEMEYEKRKLVEENNAKMMIDKTKAV